MREDPATLNTDGAAGPKQHVTALSDESFDVLVRDIVGRRLGVDANTVTDTDSFRDDLGADFLDVFDLLLVFEETFRIEIPDAAVDSMPRIADAIAYLKTHAPSTPPRHTGSHHAESSSENGRS